MPSVVKHTKSSPRDWMKAAFAYPAGLCHEGCGRLIIEIGPGRGDFLFHLARENPDALVVGIEIKRKRVDKLIHRVERFGLTNIIIIQDDARAALPRMFKEGLADEIHINFPDPWPKKRHKKNRAASLAFLKECRRVLKIDGSLNFITDHAPYADDVAEDLSQVVGLKNCYDEKYLTDMPDAYPTFFAMKWKKMGRTITYQKYKKTVPRS